MPDIPIFGAPQGGEQQIPMVPHMAMPLSIFTTNEQVQVNTPDGPRLQMFVKMFVSAPWGLTVLYFDADTCIATARAMMKHARMAELNGFQLLPQTQVDVPEDEEQAIEEFRKEIEGE